MVGGGQVFGLVHPCVGFLLQVEEARERGRRRLLSCFNGVREGGRGQMARPQTQPERTPIRRTGTGRWDGREQPDPPGSQRGAANLWSCPWWAVNSEFARMHRC